MKTFFIAGSQRSGTTLLSVLLSKHKDIHIDLDTVVYRITTCFGLYKQVLPYNLEFSKEEILAWLVKNDYKGRLAKLVHEETIRSGKNIVEVIQKSIETVLEEESKIIFGDKAPEIEHFMPELLMLIPNAKIIHLVRDGRDVSFSKHKRAHTNLYYAAQQWHDSNVLALSNQAILGEKQYKIVKYEDLLQHPEEELTKICSFLELEYDAQMWTNYIESRSTDDDSYVKSKLDVSKVGKYKTELSNRQIKKIEKIQGPLLKRLGYELNFPIREGKHKPSTVLNRLSYALMNHFQQLFVNQRTGMRSGKNIVVKNPLKVRLQTFAFMLCYEFIPKRYFNSIFLRRWVKNSYLIDELIKKKNS